MPSRIAAAVLALALLAVALELGTSLGRPLLWNDEGETAMYGERVLAFGYPAVDDGRNVVFECSCPRDVGARGNVYVGSTWGQYLLGAVGAAWAHGSADDGERTARLRAPFVVAGCFALLLAAGTAAGFFCGRAPALLAAAAVVALCGLSLPLVLHLRQARHPAPATLLAVAAVAVHLRRWILGRGGLGAELLEALLLVLLWHTFHPGALLLAAALASERGIEALRRERGWACLFAALRDTRAVWIAALALIPSVLYWRPFEVAAQMRPHVSVTPAVYASHLYQIAIQFLALRDGLVPALVLLVAALWLRGRGALSRDEERRVSAACAIALVIGAYVALLCAFPFVWQRYVVELSPLVAIGVVLAGSAVASAAARPHGRPAAAASALVLGVWAVWAGPTRLGELAGFERSLLAPPRGPLDAAVAEIRAAYRDPSRLTIGTTYEISSLQWYLGARVSRGPFEAPPDVLIPRRGWPYGLAELQRWNATGGYRQVVLGAANWPWNDIPELRADPRLPLHRWTSPLAGVDGPPLVLFFR